MQHKIRNFRKNSEILNTNNTNCNYRSYVNALNLYSFLIQATLNKKRDCWSRNGGYLMGSKKKLFVSEGKAQELALKHIENYFKECNFTIHSEKIIAIQKMVKVSLSQMDEVHNNREQVH